MKLIIFDIGAHTFYDGITYKRTFPEIEVYAFEPDKRMIDANQHFAKNVGVNIIPVALCDFDGETMYYPSDSLGGQMHTDSGGIFPVIEYNPHMVWGQPYLVKCSRFDTFCDMNNISEIDYVHMDVQGAEHRVMKSIREYRPKYIFAETCAFSTYDTNTSIEEFNTYMESLGYEIHKKLQYDTLYKYKN